ncbi:MAG: aminopeptidase [Planctomycetes bacterium]|nr:aminopeptidase [Planctomycetota bacterium]
MTDPRIETLAELLIGHSVALAPGEHVLIEAFDVPEAIVIAIVAAARRAGGHPHVALRSNRVLSALYRDGGEDGFRVWSEYDTRRMALMQAYIGVRGSHNVSEFADIADEQMKMHAQLYQKPVHFEQRVAHTRWCVLRWPTPAMAQLARMSTEAFERFYFDVCTLDYAKMQQAVQPLADRMRRTDRVRIAGPGETDLSFSIKGVDVVPCYGTHNVPDGECFTSPVRDSINGVIHFNTPTIYNGVTFENIRLEFRDGRVVGATAAENQEKLDSILDTDEGARFVGEFALGFNPHINEAMKDILFDEKIAGSLHLTPGRAYAEADNGNRSDIHWDLVLIQRPEYGGGRIYFDDELIRDDGEFVGEALAGLNPDGLRGASGLPAG